jgi:hypothetical protein
VSDLDDKVVSYRSQREFVDRVRARGLPIVHIAAAAEATDRDAHDLYRHALHVTAACAKGIDDRELITRYQNKTREPAKPVAEPRRDPTPASAPADGVRGLFSRQPITVAAPDKTADDPWRQWDRHGRGEVARDATTAKPVVETYAVAAKPSGFVAWLVSTRSEAEAQAAFRGLQAKHPAVLGNLTALIRRVERGDGGAFYRAQVGPFAGDEEASAFCDRLKAAGGRCIVYRN